MCAGRAAKRKADIVAEAEPVAKQDKGQAVEQEDDEGQRVIIEHWSVRIIEGKKKMFCH